MVRCCNDFTFSDGLQIANFENLSLGGIQLDNFEDTTLSGTLLDGFENLAGWILGGTGSSYQTDNINFKEGTQGIRVNATTGSRANIDKILSGSSNDFSLTQNFTIWVYVYDIITFNSLTIYITSVVGTSFSKNFSKSTSSMAPLQNGWNKLILDKSTFVNTGGESWTNLMNRIRISVFPNVGQNTSVTLDNLRYDGSYDWIVGGAGASKQPDTVNFIEGSQGLKVNSVNGVTAVVDKILTGKDFSITNNFGVWLYIYDITTFGSIRLYFTSGGSAWSKYFLSSIAGVNLKVGWNKLIFDKTAFTNTGSDSWTNLMNRIRISIVPIAGQSTSATLDDLRYDVNYDWITGGIGATSEPDIINFKEGTQGFKLNASNGNSAYTDITINKDFSNTNNFIVWAYVFNADNTGTIRLYLTSTGAVWSKYLFDACYSFKTGWNRIIFNKHSFTNTGSDSWTNLMNRIRIEIVPKPLQNISVTFDDLRYDIKGKRAKLMFHFDDGELNTYTKAFPILSANNQRGVSFVITSYVDTNVNFMTRDNLSVLRDAGWDISSHTVNHADLRTVDDVTLTYELQTSYEWLRDNGFHKSAGFIAYPFGGFNDNVINKSKQIYVMGRATVNESAQQFISTTDDTIQYIQRKISVNFDTTVQSVIDKLDDAINAKLLTILVLHTIADSNPTNDLYTTLTSDLQLISNYIKSREADIDVITYSDYTIYDCIDIVANLAAS